MDSRRSTNVIRRFFERQIEAAESHNPLERKKRYAVGKIGFGLFAILTGWIFVSDGDFPSAFNSTLSGFSTALVGFGLIVLGLRRLLYDGDDQAARRLLILGLFLEQLALLGIIATATLAYIPRMLG